jgi:hypothetical protein
MATGAGKRRLAAVAVSVRMEAVNMVSLMDWARGDPGSDGPSGPVPR